MYSSNFFLVGFAGSGKTFWGSKLSKTFGLEWQDTDQEIERKYQTSVASIFTQQGEATFRKYETEMLHFLVHKNTWMATLVTTGGGTPCFNENMAYMKSHGTVIWLDVPTPILIQRLSNSSSRPLIANLNGQALEEYITENLEKRKAFYQEAHCHIENPQTVDDFATIFSELKK